MNAWFIVSVILNILLVFGAGYLVYILNRAGEQINQYELFYQNTIEAIEKQLRFMQNAMALHVEVTADDTIRKVFQAMKAFYGTLIGYYNAGKDAASNKAP